MIAPYQSQTVYHHPIVIPIFVSPVVAPAMLVVVRWDGTAVAWTVEIMVIRKVVSVPNNVIVVPTVMPIFVSTAVPPDITAAGEEGGAAVMVVSIPNGMIVVPMVVPILSPPQFHLPCQL